VIEVNLLPGGKKGSSGGFSFSMPKLGEMFSRGRGGGGGGAPTDRYAVFFAVATALALGYVGYTFWSTRTAATELAVQLEEERQDSIRHAATIERTNQLQARGDSIARRVAIIQEIDAGRYVWPHLLDEVAAAVADYTWLREITYQSDNPLQVRVLGRAGSIFAITNFMRRLEASSFLRNVTTENIQQVPSEEDPNDRVQEFELVMTYEPPPIDEMETVPLFDQASAQSAAPEGN
jgi:Tfp pilus assembly protein PilN